MRIAVVSDIHGNLTALDAVLADLHITSPDLILHGGDVAGPGSRPAEVVDRIRDLAWPGVLGNADEMLYRPASLDEFLPAPFNALVAEMADATRDALGPARIAWLSTLPLTQVRDDFTLLHACPENCWRSPTDAAPDADLDRVYGALAAQRVVYAHIHVPFVRELETMTIANTGSVGLSYDGDPRAAYLLMDGNKMEIRRVEYKVEREIAELESSHLPRAGWIAKMLRTARPAMP